MTIGEFKDVAAGISSCTTAIAVVGGGLWALWHYVLGRETNPKIEFNVHVNFIRVQDDFWILEAVADIENKGLVRHRTPEFTFSIRYLTEADPVEPDGKFGVCLPHRAAKGSWLPENWDKSFAEPGIHIRYSAPAPIPKEATTVLIHGKFHYENGEWHTADKLLAVPPCPQIQSNSQHHESIHSLRRAIAASPLRRLLLMLRPLGCHASDLCERA